MLPEDKYVLLFDGDCTLCNRAVQWVLLRDKKDRFRFGSLQSATAEKLLQHAPSGILQTDSVILIAHGHFYQQSTAALKTVVALGGFYKAAYALILIPAPLRDAVYRWIARNRKKWWPYDASCMVPRKEWAHKFID